MLGDVELSYLVVETALGWFGLVLSPRGLRATTLPRPSRQEAEREAIAMGASRPATADQGREVARRLQEYALGRPVSFADLPLDWAGLGTFQRRVLEALLRLPWGQITTYSELARLVGRPGAARAVGRVMATNPLPVVVPCHRVVGANGSLTGYGGGLEMKARLLALEGVPSPAGPPGRSAGRGRRRSRPLAPSLL